MDWIKHGKRRSGQKSLRPAILQKFNNIKTTQFQVFICEPLNLFQKKSLSTAKIEIHKLFIKNIFQIKFTGKIKISIIYLHCNSLSFMHTHIRFWSIPIYLKLENYKSLNADFMTISTLCVCNKIRFCTAL